MKARPSSRSTQDEPPRVRTEIDRAGVEGVLVPLTVKVADMRQTPLCRINLHIDLDGQRKGVHMSRLVESIFAVASKFNDRGSSLERLAAAILDELATRHSYSRGEAIIETPLAFPRLTPSTRRGTIEAYQVKVSVRRINGTASKRLQVDVVGSTLCPHSLAITGQRAHSQRAKVTLSIETNWRAPLQIENLVSICEESLSAPALTVLKTEDEEAVVSRMYSNPKFVEDVVRDCFNRVLKLGITGRVRIKAIAYESIHKHNAVSEIVRRIDGGT